MRFPCLWLIGFLLLVHNLPQVVCAYSVRFHPLPQDASLKLNQIERLLDIQFEDALLAREIKRRGIAFKVDERLIERLLKRGLGTQAKLALWLHEETKAYAAFAQESSDLAKRLTLAQSFLKQYPQSEHAAFVGTEIKRLEYENLRAGFQTFSLAPDAHNLNQLIQTGQSFLLNMPESDQTGTVVTWLALATARGTLAGFYQNLEQGQNWAKQAINWLNRSTEAQDNKEFSAAHRLRSLAELHRAQALYLLRQPDPDPERGLLLLSRAVQAEPTGVGTEPLTFWLQAMVREISYQQQLKGFSNGEPSSPERRGACAKLIGIKELLVEDYTHVVTMSKGPKDQPLREEAAATLKKLLSASSPCDAPPGAPDKDRAAIQSAPIAQQRARKVKPDTPKLRTIFIQSKTVYLKPNQLEAALLKRPEFQSGDWRIIRNQKAADYVVEISLPFMTWNWSFEVTQPATTALLATGKVREATAGMAVPRLAEALHTILQQLRAAEIAAKGGT
jgi:hypothetical protein